MKKLLLYISSLLISCAVLSINAENISANVNNPTYSSAIVSSMGNGIPSYSDNQVVKSGLVNSGITQLTVDDNSHVFRNMSQQVSYRVGLNPEYNYSLLNISPQNSLKKDYPFIVSHVALVSENSVSPLSFSKTSDGSYNVDLTNVSVKDNSYIIYSLEPAKSSDDGSHGQYHVSMVSDFTIYATDKNNGQSLVNGSAYTDKHPEWGTLWGIFSNQYNVAIDNNIRTTDKGSLILSSLVKDFNNYKNGNFTVINSNGNVLANNVSSYNFNSEGTYFVKFLGQLSNGDYVWNSSEVKVTGTVTLAKVTAKYVDDKGNVLSANDVLSGRVGEKYSTTQKNITGYTFKEVQGNASGIFTDQEQTVTYIYTKEPVTSGSVTTKYVNDKGYVIADNVVLHGNVGEAYQTEQKQIAGYTFKEVQGKASGKYSDQAQEVTYVYTKDAVKPGETNKPVSPVNPDVSTEHNQKKYPEKIKNSWHDLKQGNVTQAAQQLLPSTAAQKAGTSILGIVILATLAGTTFLLKNKKKRD